MPYVTSHMSHLLEHNLLFNQGLFFGITDIVSSRFVKFANVNIINTLIFFSFFFFFFFFFWGGGGNMKI